MASWSTASAVSPCWSRPAAQPAPSRQPMTMADQPRARAACPPLTPWPAYGRASRWRSCPATLAASSVSRGWKRSASSGPFLTHHRGVPRAQGSRWRTTVSSGRRERRRDCTKRALRAPVRSLRRRGAPRPQDAGAVPRRAPRRGRGRPLRRLRGSRSVRPRPPRHRRAAPASRGARRSVRAGPQRPTAPRSPAVRRSRPGRAPWPRPGRRATPAGGPRAWPGPARPGERASRAERSPFGPRHRRR